jgi:uncharacterized protein (TIGR00369 family)
MSDKPNEPAGEWREMKTIGLMERIGPLLARRDGEAWRYGLRTDAQHGNPIGVIHGGTLMTLLDQIATLAAVWLTGEKAVMTVQMDTRFLAAAKVGDLIEGVAQLRHRTRTMLFLDAQLSVAGQPVTDASVIMKVLPQSTKVTTAKDA